MIYGNIFSFSEGTFHGRRNFVVIHEKRVFMNTNYEKPELDASATVNTPKFKFEMMKLIINVLTLLAINHKNFIKIVLL